MNDTVSSHTKVKDMIQKHIDSIVRNENKIVTLEASITNQQLELNELRKTNEYHNMRIRNLNKR